MRAVPMLRANPDRGTGTRSPQSTPSSKHTQPRAKVKHSDIPQRPMIGPFRLIEFA